MENKDVTNCLRFVLDALEKQIPEKPICVSEGEVICPNCKRQTVFTKTGNPFVDYQLNFCDNCGQKLCWEGVTW